MGKSKSNIKNKDVTSKKREDPISAKPCKKQPSPQQQPRQQSQQQPSSKSPTSSKDKPQAGVVKGPTTHQSSEAQQRPSNVRNRSKMLSRIF